MADCSALLVLARLLVIARAYAHNALLVHAAVLLENVDFATILGNALLMVAMALLLQSRS